MKWGGPNATSPTNGYKISSSRPRYPRRELCNRPVLWAPACGWISSLRATRQSTLAAVPQLGSGKRLWTIVVWTVRPPVQPQPRIEYAGDHRSRSSRSVTREHQPLPPPPLALTSPPPKQQPFPPRMLQPGKWYIDVTGGAAAAVCTRGNLGGAAAAAAAAAASSPDASGAATGGAAGADDVAPATAEEAATAICRRRLRAAAAAVRAACALTTTPLLERLHAPSLLALLTAPQAPALESAICSLDVTARPPHPPSLPLSLPPSPPSPLFSSSLLFLGHGLQRIVMPSGIAHLWAVIVGPRGSSDRQGRNPPPSLPPSLLFLRARITTDSEAIG